MSDFIAKISAELDTSKLEAQLRNLNNKQYKINLSSGNAQQNINDINKSISNTTKTTKSFGDTLKNSFKIGSTASIVYRSFDLITDAANGALNAVKDIDNAIKDLRMATGYTYEETSNLVSGYNQMAQSLGATTTEMTKGADAWLRQGHSVADTNTLITDSMILSKVANLDSADATEYLTSAMKGYGVAVNDVIGIVDKLTSVDLVSATSADGLAEAMSRTAVSADMAGVSMDKLLGYLAATGEVTQESMSVIGNAFKTFFARYSAIKTGKLELIDEDGTTEVLSDVEQSLKNVGINIRSTITDFDNAGDALDDLSSKWNTLNGVQKSAIASAFGGTRQKNRFLVLMENYQKAQSYMQTAENSTGTAEKKFSAYIDTIEAKTKSLQASFEALATDTVSTDMLKGIIDASAAVVEFVDNTNLLKGSLAGVVTAGVIAGFNKLAKGISSAAVNMSDFGNAMTLLKNGEVGLDDFNDLILMTQNLSDSQLKAVLSSQALTNEQKIAILTAQGLSASEAQTALSSMGLASAEGAATASTFSLSAALKGLWVTCKAHPLLLIAAGVTAATMAFSALSEAAENAAQAAAEQAKKSKEAADKAKEESDTLSELIAKYKELKQSDKWDVSTREEIKNIQTEITKIVGAQADNLDLVNGKLDDEIDKLNTLRNIIQGDSLSTYEKAYTDAQKAVADKKYSKNWLNALLSPSDSLYIDADALGTKIIGDAWAAQGYNAKATYMAGGESVFNLPQDISEKTAALDVAIRALEDYNGYDFANSGLWNRLGEIKEDLFGSDGLITNQVDAANDLLEQLADKNVDEDVNLSTFDDYLAYRQEVIDKVLGNKVIKKAIEDGALSNDSITTYIDSYLGTLDKFSEYYEKFNINNNMSDLKTMFYNWNFEDALPEVSEFNKWIDSLKDDKKEIVYDIYCNTDTATWNLERWQNALDNYNANDYREVIATTFTDLMAEEDTDSESSFTTKVDDYIESVNKLQEALDNYRKGELKNEDLTELIKLFPELAGETDNLDEALVNLIDTLTYGTNGKGGINAEFDFQFKRKVNFNSGVNLDSGSLETIKKTIAEINPDMLVKAGLDADVVENYTPPTKTVTYESDFSKIANPPTLEGKVIYNAEFPFVPTGTNNTKTNDISELKNSAKTIPSFPGFSYAQGNADNALVGELKPELLVRDGKYHLLGKDSAELYEHKKGDIIFNGEQTEQLLRSGKITQALNYAVKTERLKSNPADKVELPKKQHHIADFYNVTELKTLLDYAKGSPIETVVLLASWFGLRRGEIIGLKWSDIDFENKTLYINGTVKDKGESGSKVKNLYYEPTAKTSSSIRSFPMPDSAVKYLSDLKLKQDERKKKNKLYNYEWKDFVCVKPNGDLLPLEYVSRAFPKLCEKAGLKRLRLHELRHTNISMLLESGASMKELQEWAGHSSYSTTANIYSHIQAKSKAKLTQSIENLLG